MSEETQPAERRVRAAYLTIERSNGYCHPRLTFGSAPEYERSNSQEYGAGFYGAGSFLDSHAPKLPKGCTLEDLEVTAQGESEKPGRLYGWEVCFKPHRVESHDVAPMARTFAYIARALDKARQDAGEPGAWADYALRICRAFKVTRLYVRRPDHCPDRYGEPTRTYEASTLRDGLHWAEWQCWTETERKAAQAAEGNA
jgi:hypothetical protein